MNPFLNVICSLFTGIADDTFLVIASVLFNQKDINWLFAGLSIAQIILLYLFNDK
jgi:hypothetical protein